MVETFPRMKNTHHTCLNPRRPFSKTPSLFPCFLNAVHFVPGGGNGRADDFAGVSRLPPACGVPHRLGFARCSRRVDCEPPILDRPPTSPPLSRVPGPQPLLARQGPSRMFLKCTITRSQSPRGPHPAALIRARDKARKGHWEDFWNPHSLGGAGLWAGACFC